MDGWMALPGKSHSSAGPVCITQDAGGDGLAEGLQHVLQLLFIHGQGQVGDVQVGGVLLLLLRTTWGGFENEVTQKTD